MTMIREIYQASHQSFEPAVYMQCENCGDYDWYLPHEMNSIDISNVINPETEELYSEEFKLGYVVVCRECNTENLVLVSNDTE